MSRIGGGRSKLERSRRDIEALLIWAYRDELSKRVTSSAEHIWDGVYDYGQIGIGRDSHSPQRYDHGVPHPDALAIEAAIGTLGSIVVDWDKSRSAIMGDLAALLASRDVLLLRSINVAALVTMHATLATRPDWHDEPPRPYMVPSPKDHRRPAVIGECRGKNLYTFGSYCPLRYEPSPISIAMARADYAAWHDGLTRLAQGLQLMAHEVMPPEAPAQPWLTGEKAAKVHYVGQWNNARPLPLKPIREVAGPPPRRNRKVVAKGAET